MNIDSEDVLFGSSNGFISAILDDDDVGDCDDAIAYSSAYTFGEYVQCEDDNAWYNNATRSLIYSVDGLTITSVTDFTSYQDELDAYADEIITHVSNHEDDIEDLILSSDPYQYIADFNNLYLAKVGSKTIFGVEEKRFDSEISMDNRNYLAVTYEGTSVDCEQIEDSYASKGDDVYCYGGEPVIVLERTVSGSEHWQSLTSKLRLS